MLQLLLLLEDRLFDVPSVQAVAVRHGYDGTQSIRQCDVDAGGKMVIMHSFQTRTAQPDRAVPPGRIGYDLDADVLLLHTIQTSAAVDELRKNGVLRPRPEHTASEWPEAYAWMVRMMGERLPTSGSTAVWLWARIRRYDLISNCRRAVVPGQEPQVLLTCRIPRERVLLSQFDEWHTLCPGIRCRHVSLG
ncbi:DUF3841 domain-containing protein [Microbacterium lacticum]|uniref:DUF3841 domain-containing protein n=1 Tax=Microbacterium lacticum TaxID=33885 RepID=UPI003A8BD7CF